MEAIARAVAVFVLPLLTVVCIAVDATPAAALAALGGVVLLSVVVDAVLPRVQRSRTTSRNQLAFAAYGAPSPAARRVCTSLVLAAPLVQGALLIYVLRLVALTPRAPASIAVMTLMLGVSAGTVGISAAHELVHRRGALERWIAHAFMLLVSYPHFRVVHLRVHHPHVGTPLDPGTSRLDEPLLRFVPRAFALSWRSAWRV